MSPDRRRGRRAQPRITRRSLASAITKHRPRDEMVAATTMLPLRSDQIRKRKRPTQSRSGDKAELFAHVPRLVDGAATAMQDGR